MLETIFPNHLPSMIGWYIWKYNMSKLNTEYYRRTFYVHNEFFIKVYFKDKGRNIGSKDNDYISLNRIAYNYRDLNKPDMYYRQIKGKRAHGYLPFRYYYTNGTYSKDFSGFSREY